MYIQFALYMVVEKNIFKVTGQFLLVSSSHVLESWGPLSYFPKGHKNLQLSYPLYITVKTCLSITSDLHNRKHCAQFPFSLYCKAGSKKEVSNPSNDSSYKVSGPRASTNVIWNGKKMTHSFSNMLRVKYLLLSCQQNEASVKCSTRKNMC